MSLSTRHRRQALDEQEARSARRKAMGRRAIAPLWLWPRFVSLWAPRRPYDHEIRGV